MKGFLLIFMLSLSADLVVDYFCLPLPGSIAGLLILLGSFAIWRSLADEVEGAARTLLDLLPLLLVPVGVSVVELATDGTGALAALVAVSIASILLAIPATVLIVRGLLRLISACRGLASGRRAADSAL